MKSDQPEPPVKCVVWDLDGTLWEGVLLEGDEVLIDASEDGLTFEFSHRASFSPETRVGASSRR